ncbi:MAG: homocysteine S-methyltransferase family protein [Treponema sp.]|jgi:5-methyltetrahydrofolate--homocysteine methyltransferase|nr:homocysteine S-methyltransferase family protein [Treponema sp.]
MEKPDITSEVKRRILILDGAMGSLIQAKLPSYRGCNDELCLTRPDLISSIHREYLQAGADIIESCSFNANPVSLADYGLADRAAEISAAAAALAAAEAASFSTPEKPRFVAGSMGPTAKSGSIPSDMADPAARAIGWDELEAAYYENARGLLDGGVDFFLVETIFDALNAKAALAALFRLFEERGVEKPVMLSATLNESGRLLTGQTIEAFLAAVLHARPFAAGFNCSFGADKLLPHIKTLAGIAPCAVSVYPNAGLPNAAGIYDHTPRIMASSLESYMKESLINILGGCCGSTPEHIAALAEAARGYAPRPFSARGADAAGPAEYIPAGFSGLELLPPVKTTPLPPTGLSAFIEKGDYDEAVELLRDGAGSGPVAVSFDKSLSPEKVSAFTRLALFYPDITRYPFIIESSRWDLIEAALKCLQGRSMVRFKGVMEGEELKRRLKRYGAASV